MKPLRLSMPKYLPNDLAYAIGRLKDNGWTFSLYRHEFIEDRIVARAELVPSLVFTAESELDRESALTALLARMKEALS